MSLDSDTIDSANLTKVNADPDSSARICLEKLSEFSRFNDLSVNASIFNRAVEFIQYVTPADYILLIRLSINRKKCTILASYGLVDFPAQLEGPQVDVVEEFCKRKIIFSSKDFGYAQVASALLGESPIRAGVSIPIKVDTEPRGCLLVFNKKDRKYSSSRINFLEQMAYQITHYLQQKLLVPFAEHTARKVVEAKQEWEKTIDAMPQLVVVLSYKAIVVRVNQAIEKWGLGSVSSMNGNSISELLTMLSPDQNPDKGWSNMWQQLESYPQVEWEYENTINGMSLRFSLRKLFTTDQADNSGFHDYQSYAVLIVDNITELVETRKQQAVYTGNLEQQLYAKVEQLEELNNRLASELEQHKDSRQALKVSQSRYTHLVENTLVGICVLEGVKIEFCNQRFADILGLQGKNVLGSEMLQLIDPEYRALVLRELNSMLSGRAHKFVGTIKASGGDRRERWINLKLNYLSNEEPEKILVNIVDVTTQKQVEMSLRESEKDLHELYGRLVNSLENERKRIASELHDGLGQMLSSIKYQVEGAIKNVDRASAVDASGFSSKLYSVVNDIRQAIEETRCMAMDLRPTILDDLGIIQTTSWFCRQFQQKYEHINVEREVGLEESDIDEKYKLVIYRIMQESFNNVVKHTNATLIKLMLYKSNDSLHLKIEDNGQGFSFEARYNNPDSGWGLNNMRERAEQSGGAFHIDSIQPTGTRVNVIWVK